MMFDQKKFLKLTEGDKYFAHSLIEIFEQDWPELIDKIKQSIKSGNCHDLEQFSNRLKGNIRNFYAKELAKKVYALEEKGRQQKLEGAEQDLDILKQDLDKLQAELEVWASSQM